MFASVEIRACSMAHHEPDDAGEVDESEHDRHCPATGRRNVPGSRSTVRCLRELGHEALGATVRLPQRTRAASARGHIWR